MKRLSFRVVLAAGLMLSISGAAVGANRKAQGMVQGLTSEQATLLVKFPALTKIDGVIRADCAVKNEGRAATDDFCGCAAAVTMGLWRSGADPNMVPRLNDYLKNPTDAAANGFLQYQGPELYRGVCNEATKR